MSNIWNHFKKICIHKFWVAYYCFKCGLYCQGIWHDMSKFSPIEFWESVKYYQGTSSPINACKADKGYSLAWQHHKGRNPHHYEYWTDRYDDGTVCIAMPYKYAVELICDWIGAARAYMGKDFSYNKEYEWWMNKLKKCPPKMHYNTSGFISQIFIMLAYAEDDKCDPFVILNKERLQSIYNLYK